MRSAQANVDRNSLNNDIQVLHIGDRSRLLKGELPVHPERKDKMYACTVCNPPFFDSVQSAGKNKKRALNATASELACPGGEEAFVGQMIEESASPTLSSRVMWFTSMLGKKKSVATLKQKLFALKPRPVVQTTTFEQGKQARWGIAWSFSPAVREALISKARQGTR